VAARLLSASDIVVSVYVRRSVAVGEVSFGRSDIDLGIVLREGLPPLAERHELLKLARLYRRIKIALPMLGECEVHDPESLRRMPRIDPYRASIDRRAAILLHGPPVQIPEAAIPQAESVRRLIFWIERYLPAAIRSRDSRNARKLALEMWNGWACATGLVPEPYLTRRDTGAAMTAGGMAVPRDPIARCFSIAADMHQRLFPPLDRMRSATIARIELAPGLHPRTLVLIADAHAPLPAEAFTPASLVATPEALALYLTYVNPFAHAHLPRAVLDLGLHPPERGDIAACCRRYAGDRQMLRSPGLATADIGGPIQRAAAARMGVAALRNDEPLGRLGPRAPAPPSLEAYYMNVYPALCAEMSDLWSELERAPDPAR
jgi:predicted nucleotidyltransferase